MSKLFYPADAVSLACFTTLCALIVTGFLIGVYVSARAGGRPGTGSLIRALLGTVLYLGAFSAIVASGWLREGAVPRLMGFLVAINLISLAIGLSPVGRSLSLHLPLSVLVGFQAFRLPLELILNQWAQNGTIPFSMTFHGANFDIVTGVVALLAAPFAGRSRLVAWAANLVGIALLVNVIRVAVLSSPLPFGWPVEPKLLLIFHLPYALIVPICVGGAIIGHIVLTRALLKANRS